MGFPESIISVFAGTFRFSGRAPRSEFWWFFLFEIFAVIVLAMIDAKTVMQVIAQSSGSPDLFTGLNPFALTLVYYSILTFFPRMAVTVRRLHDVGLSGWFYLIYFVPVVGGLVVMIIMMLPSESGGNKFGPPHNRFHRERAPGKADPMQGYATLSRAQDASSADMQAARKAEVRALYEQRVLGITPAPAE